MLDKVFSRLKDEIGIDGTQGADIATVWKYIENILKDISQENNINITPVIDDQYKAYVWEYLRNLDDVTFYVKHKLNNENLVDLPEEQQDLPEEQQDLPEQQGQIDQEQPTNKRKKAKKTSVKKKKAKKPAKEKKAKKRRAADSDDDFEASGTSSESEEESEEEDEASESEQEEGDEQDTKANATQRKPNTKIDREPKKQNETISAPTQDLGDFEKVHVNLLDYAKVESAFGNNLHIIASEKIQQEQLTKNLPPDSSLSYNITIILREILKTRASGYYQANLTKNFGLDARSTGHYCKVLEEKGAITRTRVTVTGFYTNLCVHARYKNSDSQSNTNVNTGNPAATSDMIPYNMNTRGEYITLKEICATIIALAKDAEAKIILARDVLYALGFETDRESVKKWYNRCISDLSEMGYVKKLKTQINGTGPLLRCIQLLKETMDFDKTANRDVDIGVEISYPLSVESINPNMKQHSLCMDLTLARQAYLHIEESKERGITQRGLSVALNSDNNRVIYRLLESIAAKMTLGYERFCVCRHIEFEKRVRRYRYFTFKTFKKITEDDDEYVYPPIPESEFDEKKLKEMNLYYDFEHNRKGFLLVLKNKSKTPPRKRVKTDGPPKPIGRPSKKKAPQQNQKAATSVDSTRKGKDTTPLVQNQEEVAVNETDPSTELEENNELATTTIISEDLIMASKEPTPCMSKEPTPAIERFLSQEPISSSQDSTITSSRTNTTTGDPSTKKSAFSILMASSRAKAKNNAPPPPAPLSSSSSSATSLPPSPPPPPPQKKEPSPQPITKSVVAVVKIPTSTLMKPKKPACAKVTATVAEAETADETAIIIATEEMEEKDIYEEPVLKTGNKRKISQQQQQQQQQQPIEEETVTPPSKTRKRGGPKKNVVEDANQTGSSTTKEPVGNEVTNSQPEQDNNNTVKSKKKSLFDYFNKGKTTKTAQIATTNIQPNVGEEEEEEENTQSDTNTPAEPMEQDQSTETSPEEEEEEEEMKNNDDAPGSSTGEKEKEEGKPLTQSAANRKAVNRYLELRKKALLKFLEKEPIFYSCKADFDQYKKIMNEMSDIPISNNIQKKTVWAACLELEKEGLAQTTTKVVRNLSGKETTYKILVRRGMDMEGEEFQELSKHLGEIKAISGLRPQFKKIQRYHAPIERLDERLKKIKKNLEQSSKNQTPAQIEKVKDALEKFASNSQSIKYRTELHLPSQVGNTWRMDQYQSGYILPKMPRTKVMHKYLLNLWSKQGNIAEQDSFVIPTTTIFGQMPCRLYLQTIGAHRFASPKVKEYLQDSNNQDTVTDNFPISILKDVFSGGTSVRSGLRDMMLILEVLGIIEPVVSKDKLKRTPIVYTAYKLNKTVDLYNFKLKKRYAAVQSFTIIDDKSLENYWSALRFVTLLEEYIEEEHRAPPIEDDIKLLNFTQMYNARSWTDLAICTPAQLEILNAYVDRPNYKTPVSDLDLCAQIAQEAKLQIESARAFYLRLQQKLDYRLEQKKKKEIERAGGIPLRKRRRFNPSRRTALVSKSTILISRYTGREIEEKGKRVGFTENLEDAPVVDLDSTDPVDEFKINRRNRVPWTDQEDEILIYCYIIIKSRVAASRDFRWNLVPQLIPQRSSSGCRNRFGVILKTTGRERIITNSSLWGKFYREGIRDGDIKDKYPDDPSNFDLISFVEYFLTRLTQVQNLKAINNLPPTTKELQHLFSIRSVEFNNETKFTEDKFHFRSLNEKLQLSLRSPCCVRSYMDDVIDSPLTSFADENSIEKRQALILKLISFMVLLTPEEEYDPFEGYNIIMHFPESLRQRVFQDLFDQDMFIYAKRERSIPGTKYTIATKFIQTMIDSYSKNLRQQAKEFEDHLHSIKKLRLDPDMISSGMMASMLNLISQNKLNITVHNRETEIQRFEYLSSQTKMIDRFINKFDVNISMINNDDDPIIRSEKHRGIFTSVSKDAYDVDFSAVISSQLLNKELGVVANGIVNYLQERASNGASPYQIKLKLNQHYSDKDIINGLSELQNTTPPIILSVGINAERYVLAIPEFLDSWVLKVDSNLSNNSTTTTTEATEATETNDDVIVRSETIINPTIWTSIKGNLTPLILNECKKKMMGLVLERPGITESVIARSLNQFMSRKEIRVLLKLLVDQKLLKVVKVASQRAKKLSLFGKTRLSRTIDENTIAECTESSYWACPDFYSVT